VDTPGTDHEGKARNAEQRTRQTNQVKLIDFNLTAHDKIVVRILLLIF